MKYIKKLTYSEKLIAAISFLIFILFSIYLMFHYINKLNIRCIDGDTFAIGEEYYRLSYIDTAEKGEPTYVASSKFTCNFLNKNEIHLRSHGTDKYGRTLVEVLSVDVNLNRELVRECLAEPFYGKTTKYIEDLYNKNCK